MSDIPVKPLRLCGADWYPVWNGDTKKDVVALYVMSKCEDINHYNGYDSSGRKVGEVIPMAKKRPFHQTEITYYVWRARACNSKTGKCEKTFKEMEEACDWVVSNVGESLIDS